MLSQKAYFKEYSSPKQKWLNRNFHHSYLPFTEEGEITPYDTTI